MRCSCVPIHFGGQLVGIAKLVVDADTPEGALKTALAVLKLVVSETCQDSAVSVLAEDVQALQQRVTDMQRMRWEQGPGAGRSDPPSTTPSAEGTSVQNGSLVGRAVAHLHRSYQDPTLSLRSVADALGCNPRYLTTRFTQILGERLHAYVVTLRVSHACRLLMGSDLLVKEIAHASGFSGAGRLASAFRRLIGVSPGEYRRIFAGP